MVLPDGNGRMSRLLTALLLYRNGFEVGKYISIESKTEKTKSVYYDVLEQTSQKWHEAKMTQRLLSSICWGLFLAVIVILKNGLT